MGLRKKAEEEGEFDDFFFLKFKSGLGKTWIRSK